MKEILGQELKSELARTLINHSPIAYIILDEEYRIHYINKSFLKLRKLNLETVVGEKCYNISNGGARCTQCAVKGALQTNEKQLVSRKDILPDGTVRYIDDYAIPLYKNEENGTQFILEIMVDRTAEMLQREQRNADYEEILSILSQLLEMKDQYTATHSQEVRKIAIQLARELSLSDQDVFDISLAASLHDIGKVSIPTKIINKPGPLSDEEFAIIKKHPLVSYDFLSTLSSFEGVKNIVRSHHERIDGRGYPDGLHDSDISLGAKIVAVADTYDAITSTRSYQQARSHQDALEEIQRVAGSQLDSEVVNALLSMNFDFDNNEAVSSMEDNRLERFVDQPNLTDDLKSIEDEDFHGLVDQDRLISKILENTPCGYVLMSPDKRNLYASSYFLEYMNLTEEQILGKVCYTAGGIGSKPCDNCAVERALQSGNVETGRQEQIVNDHHRIFDVYAMPLMNDEDKPAAVIEMIIDRTEEALMERKREHDFNTLINHLTQYLEEHMEDESQDVSQQISKLRQRLYETLEKRKD